MPVHWISFPTPSSAEGAGILLDPLRKKLSIVGVISFPRLSFTWYSYLLDPVNAPNMQPFFLTLLRFEASLHIWHVLYSCLSRFFSTQLISSYFSMSSLISDSKLRLFLFCSFLFHFIHKCMNLLISFWLVFFTAKQNVRSVHRFFP